MGVLFDAVTLEDWREVVGATVVAAKAGDTSARMWLAQYLLGKPGVTAPAPLTVVVQQLSGRDPLVDELAAPYIDRVACLPISLSVLLNVRKLCQRNNLLTMTL